MAEVEIGNMAVTKATSADVRAFAQRVLEQCRPGVLFNDLSRSIQHRAAVHRNNQAPAGDIAPTR